MNINKIIDTAETINNEVSILKDTNVSVKDIKKFFGELPYPEIIVDIDDRLTSIANWINGDKITEAKIEETASSVPVITRPDKHPGGNWSYEARNAIINHVVEYCDGMTIGAAVTKCINDLGLYQSPIKIISKKSYTKFTDGVFEIVRGKIKVIN
jgi:hypothetical protein